jgi:hypothetical protein
MKSNRKRILSISMALVLIISGLFTITTASLAESDENASKLKIEGLSWDKTNQGFVVALSLNFGLATAGEHADFLIATTLKIDAHGISVTLNGESAIKKAEGAIKDSENMIRIESIIIPWDRLMAGQKFTGLVDVDVDAKMDHFTPGQNTRMADSHAAYRGTSITGCTSDEQCDDGNKCNGQEICVGEPGECIAGTPLFCDEGYYCIVGNCDPSTVCDPTTPCYPPLPITTD